MAGPGPDSLTGQLVELAERVLNKAAPGEQLEVVVGKAATTSVRSYGLEVEALTVADVAGIGIRVVSDGRQGFASAGSHEPEVIDEALREARDNMAFAVPDPHVRLASPDQVEPPRLDLWDDELEQMSTDHKVVTAIELERMVRQGDSRISGVRTAMYADRAGVTVVANSNGIVAATRSTSASVGVSAMAADGERTQTGGGSSVARGPAGLDLQKAADEAVDRATSLLGAAQPQSTRLTLVLEPRMVGSLLGIIGAMFSGERVLKGRTPFADRIGETVANPALTMTDDPTDPDSFGARIFDGEGLAARAKNLVVDGVLQMFLYDTTSGSKAGVSTTASAVRGVRSTPGVSWHALSVSPGRGSVEDLIQGVDDGLLVYSMTGLHSGVNAVSGDFSVGAEGLRIRGGQLAEPVREVTIASTLPRLLTDIETIGGEIEHLPGGVSCPAMSVVNVSMGGK